MEIKMALNFISPDLLIIVFLLYCIGLFLKQIESIPDYIIPLTLLVFGVAFGVLYSGFVLNLGFSTSAIVVAIVQGVICASVAVFGNQILKQMLEKSYYDKEK